MNQRKKSVIIHISRPVRAIIRQFSLIMLAVISLFLLYISTSNNKFSVYFKEKTLDIIAPIGHTVSTPFIFISDLNQQLSKYINAIDENEKLREENYIIKEQLASLSKVENENNRLRQLLNFTTNVEHSYVSARVVGDVQNPFFRSILIDAGKNEGIKKGQAVINKNGLVGRIIEVGQYNSRVLLLTDINSKIPIITKISHERAIIAGNNTNFLELNYVNNKKDIQIGEEVLTSGDGELFPPDIKIGTVYKLEKNRFLVKPLASWNKVDYVSIVNYTPVIISPKLSELKQN